MEDSAYLLAVAWIDLLLWCGLPLYGFFCAWQFKVPGMKTSFRPAGLALIGWLAPIAVYYFAFFLWETESKVSKHEPVLIHVVLLVVVCSYVMVYRRAVTGRRRAVAEQRRAEAFRLRHPSAKVPSRLGS